MRIPTFEEAEAACDAGEGTPLDKFVYMNEPAGPDDKEFREQLQAVIDFLIGSGGEKPH